MISDKVVRRSLHEGLITALSIGGFFIILGFVFAFTPGIAQQTSNFFNDITTVSYNLSNTNTISLLAPGHPDSHQAFYNAAINFFIGVAVLNVVVLALRLAFHSWLRRIAQSVGDIIFWAGAAVSANVFLLAGTLGGWWQFWASLIIILGVSLIVRGIIHFSARWRGSNQPCC